MYLYNVTLGVGDMELSMCCYADSEEDARDQALAWAKANLAGHNEETDWAQAVRE